MNSLTPDLHRYAMTHTCEHDFIITSELFDGPSLCINCEEFLLSTPVEMPALDPAVRLFVKGRQLPITEQKEGEC